MKKLLIGILTILSAQTYADSCLGPNGDYISKAKLRRAEMNSVCAEEIISTDEKVKLIRPYMYRDFTGFSAGRDSRNGWVELRIPSIDDLDILCSIAFNYGNAIISTAKYELAKTRYIDSDSMRIMPKAEYEVLKEVTCEKSLF